MSQRTPAATKQVVSRLVTDARERGEGINELVTNLARQHGVSRTTIYRWADGQHLEPRSRTGLDRQQLVIIAQHQGNLRAAYEDLKRNGLHLSYSQFCRRFEAVDTDFRIAVTEGVQAMIRAGLFNSQDGQYERSDVFGFDHTEVPVWVRDPGEDKPRKMWISVALDWATGFIFTPTFTEGDERLKGDPNTTSIVSLVTSVMLGQAVGEVRVGGVPSLWVFDNAAAHFAEEVRQGFMHLGTNAHAIRPGSPWENGPTENAINCIELAVWRRLPGYTNHLPTRFAKPLWSDDDLLSPEQLIAITVAGIDKINREAVLKRLDGRTRLQSWVEAPGLLEFAPLEQVRHVFTRPHDGERKVNKSGVYFNNLYYTSPKFAGHVGRTVEVRHLKTDASFIDVYLDGELLCTAEPAKNLSATERSIITRQRRSRQAGAERIQKLSKERAIEQAEIERSEAILSGEITPEEDMETWNGFQVDPATKTMFELADKWLDVFDLDALEDEGVSDVDR